MILFKWLNGFVLLEITWSIFENPILNQFTLFDKLILLLVVQFFRSQLQCACYLGGIHWKLLDLFILFFKLSHICCDKLFVGFFVFKPSDQFDISFSVDDLTQVLLVEKLFELIGNMGILLHFIVQFYFYIMGHVFMQKVLVFFNVFVKFSPLIVYQSEHTCYLFLKFPNLIFVNKSFLESFVLFIKLTFICF